MTRSVLITGASAGIGEALVREYLKRGWRVAGMARRAELLDAMRVELGERFVPYPVDVADSAAVMAGVAALDEQLGGLDLVIANAGSAVSAHGGQGKFASIQAVLQLNLLGAIATLEAALPLMRARGRGQVVGITSLARYRGLPGLAAYSASKAGFSRYLQALVLEYRDSPLAITELAPGYIDTELNRHMPSRPFVISAAEAANQMAALIDRRVAYSCVPRWPWLLLGPLLAVVPARIVAAGQ